MDYDPRLERQNEFLKQEPYIKFVKKIGVYLAKNRS